MKVNPTWIRRPDRDIAGADWEAWERPDGGWEMVPCAIKPIREDQIAALAAELADKINRVVKEYSCVYIPKNAQAQVLDRVLSSLVAFYRNPR